MCFVLTFPKYVLLGILKEWLVLVEICVLDTSICSNVGRKQFLDLFVHSDVIYEVSEEITAFKVLFWMIKKFIKVKKINLLCDGEKMTLANKKLLQTDSFATHLINLTLETGNDASFIILLNILNQCPNLLTLKMKGEDILLTSQILSITKCVPDVTEFHLIGYRFKDNLAVEQICKRLKLRVLSVIFDSTMATDEFFISELVKHGKYLIDLKISCFIARYLWDIHNINSIAKCCPLIVVLVW